MKSIPNEQIVGAIMNTLLQADRGLIENCIKQVKLQIERQNNNISIDEVGALLKWQETSSQMMGDNMEVRTKVYNTENYSATDKGQTEEIKNTQDAADLMVEVLKDMNVKIASNDIKDAISDLSVSSFYIGLKKPLTKTQTLQLAGILYDKGNE